MIQAIAKLIVTLVVRRSKVLPRCRGMGGRVRVCTARQALDARDLLPWRSTYVNRSGMASVLCRRAPVEYDIYNDLDGRLEAAGARRTERVRSVQPDAAWPRRTRAWWMLD